MLKARSIITFLLLILLVIGCAAPGVEQPGTPTTETSAPPPASTTESPSPATPTSASSLPSFANVITKVEPAVVFIFVETQSVGFFRQPLTQTGSGVILSSDGYILTNYHVVEDFRRIEVTLPDYEEPFSAQLIGTDPLSDLAVIKIEGSNLPVAEFGDPAQLRVGDFVLAIGNALALEGGPSVTLGIVSNLERSYSIGQTAYYDIIQTDAAINPGNSGGPLIDAQGRVVGINTFIVSGAENIGFAINVSTVRPVFEDLISSSHHVIRPYLGATMETLTPTLATELDLPRKRGALIIYVAPGSPADSEGLQTNDIITSFQDQEVAEATKLIKMLWQYQVGDRVKITFYRQEEEQEIWVTLAERPADYSSFLTPSTTFSPATLWLST